MRGKIPNMKKNLGKVTSNKVTILKAARPTKQQLLERGAKEFSKKFTSSILALSDR